MSQSFSESFELGRFKYDRMPHSPTCELSTDTGATLEFPFKEPAGKCLLNLFYNKQNENEVFARLYRVNNGDFDWYKVTPLEGAIIND